MWVDQSDAAANPDPISMLDALHGAGEGLTAADAASHLTAVREELYHPLQERLRQEGRTDQHGMNSCVIGENQRSAVC